jgi:hypothetical protein
VVDRGIVLVGVLSGCLLSVTELLQVSSLVDQLRGLELSFVGGESSAESQSLKLDLTAS